ncbi:MAG: hypothetical protein V3V78_04565 [Candidatus Woesearchaeota archaeon]
MADEENKDKKLVDEDDSWFEEDKFAKEDVEPKVTKSEDKPKEDKIEVKELDDEDIEKEVKHDVEVSKEEEPKEERSKEEKPFEPTVEEDKKIKIWQIVSAVLAVILIISVYTGGFKGDGESTTTVSGAGIVILNDERCDTCDTAGLITQLQQTFPGMEITELDYSSKEGKKIYKDSKLSVLPAVLFNDGVKEDANYGQVEQFLDESGDFLSLKIGAAFNPEAEICDNEVDDNGDGDTDCEDATCKGTWRCMDKKEVPEVELFIMSHCPYGTQMEKGMLPVVTLLGDKIDFEVKFVNYAMHGEVEVYEQTSQYCIQKEQNDKFINYLNCFLKEGDSADCLEKAEIDKTALALCEQFTDLEFKITENFEDKASYRGNYPQFNINDAENQKYDVRGSPTLVINGATASTGRDSVSLLKAVCTGFEEAPEECDEEIDAAQPSPGFGFEPSSDTGATTAVCG